MWPFSNFKFEKFTYSNHAQKRMFERNISAQDAEDVIMYGEVIEEYLNDKPYPSYLVFGTVKNRPIHVVVAANKIEGIIISLYEPDIDRFGTDFKTRKK